MSFFTFLQYLKYKRRARSRHGIHSPYVYTFIEKVLRHTRPQLLHDKLLNYFGAENVVEVADVNKWKEAVLNAKDKTVILLKDIHSTPLHRDTWNTVHQAPSVRLSMDIYRYGILLFSEEFKEKQHFVLKNPG